MGTWVISLDDKFDNVRLTIYLHPVSRLRIRGAILLLPLYTFTVCIDRNCCKDFFYKNKTELTQKE